MKVDSISLYLCGLNQLQYSYFSSLISRTEKVDFSLTCADFIAFEKIFLLSFYLKAPNSVNVNYRLNYLGTHKSHTQTYEWLLTKIFPNLTHCFFFNNSIVMKHWKQLF